MRAYTKTYLDVLAQLDTSGNPYPYAEQIKVSLEKASPKVRAFLENGLSVIGFDDDKSCASDNYLLTVLETLTDIDRENLQGAKIKALDKKRRYVADVLTVGKHCQFDKETNNMLDSYLDTISEPLSNSAFMVFNRTLEDVSRGKIGQGNLQEALYYGEVFELIEDRYKAWSDNDDPRAILMSQVINEISEKESGLSRLSTMKV